ncbi:MAG TPA: acyl carrier protein [Pirellulaceae bacterium]|nr:acyl carrier protein [Pirellulaceae bacterium]
MDRERLRGVLSDVFEKCVDETVGDLRDDTKLREGLNLDSIDLLSMSIEIQSQLNLTLTSGDLDDLTTVGDLLDLLQAKTATARRSAA